MKSGIPYILSVLIALVFATGALGQGFDSGSDGSFGPINITMDTTLDMPPNGIFNATTIGIAAGATLRFNNNALNTPVYLLATGDVTIDGIIIVSGKNGTAVPPAGGEGGPGGFDGGTPGAGPAVPPGAGHGPGAGLADDSTFGGMAGYGMSGGSSIDDGQAYGSPLLVPIVGGSGGGGEAGQPGTARGGGGGGGAIVIASNTKIDISADGIIASNGGVGRQNNSEGSGGAIRLVAPIVEGAGSLRVIGNSNQANSTNGAGRIRIDTIDRSSLQLDFVPFNTTTIGSLMTVFPVVSPRLDIISAAGTVIPEGQPDPVVVLLPLGSPTMQQITVQARDSLGVVPINVVLTPESGDPIVVPTDIDMSMGNPASVTIDVDFPVNTVVRVMAWTR